MKYGSSGVGTEGNASSSRSVDIVVVGDEVHMLNEWWARPSTEGRPDYSSRVSTEKGLGLDEKVSKKKKTIYLKLAKSTMILEPALHRSR